MALKNREKIFIGLAVFALTIWAFDYAYYTPQSRNIRRLKAEIKAADLKTEEFLILTKGLETLEADVLRQEEELKRMGEKTLKGGEFRAFLKHLARESDPLQMKILSISPKENKRSTPEAGKEPDIFSRYKKIQVRLVLHSTYNKLGAYLRGIEELPLLVHIDSFEIQKNEEIFPFLKVNMELSLYTISL